VQTIQFRLGKYLLAFLLFPLCGDDQAHHDQQKRGDADILVQLEMRITKVITPGQENDARHDKDNKWFLIAFPSKCLDSLIILKLTGGSAVSLIDVCTRICLPDLESNTPNRPLAFTEVSCRSL
jgi:hypothetical protein